MKSIVSHYFILKYKFSEWLNQQDELILQSIFLKQGQRLVCFYICHYCSSVISINIRVSTIVNDPDQISDEDRWLINITIGFVQDIQTFVISDCDFSSNGCSIFAHPLKLFQIMVIGQLMIAFITVNRHGHIYIVNYQVEIPSYQITIAAPFEKPGYPTPGSCHI